MDNNIDSTLPFPSQNFAFWWQEWLEDRKERKIKKYTSRGLPGALNHLKLISNNDEATAILIIKQSIHFGYQGLFPLKNTFNATKQFTKPQPSDVPPRGFGKL